MARRTRCVGDYTLAKWCQPTAEDIERSLREPNKPPGAVRTLKDMSEEEILEIERRTGVKVKR